MINSVVAIFEIDSRILFLKRTLWLQTIDGKIKWWRIWKFLNKILKNLKKWN